MHLTIFLSLKDTQECVCGVETELPILEGLLGPAWARGALESPSGSGRPLIITPCLNVCNLQSSSDLLNHN